MGILDRVLSWPSGRSVWTSPPEARSTPISSLNNPNEPLYQALVDSLDGLGGSGGLSGLPPVNTETAGYSSALYRAVALKACTVAGMPVQVYARDPDGSRTEVEDEVDRYLWGRPNDDENRQEFWETAFAHLELHGDMYLLPERSGLGTIGGLRLIHPQRMKPFRDPVSLRKFFVLDGKTDAVPLAALGRDGSGDVIHIRNLTWSKKNELRGFGLIDLARLGLQLSRAGEEYGARFFSQGSQPGVYLTTDQDMADDDAEKLARRWARSKGGLKNSHLPAVLKGGLKAQSSLLDPEDAQTLQTRNFQVKEVSRWTGVPPHLLMDPTGSTSWGAGLEEQGRAFVTYTLGNLSRRTELEVSDLLLGAPRRFMRWDYRSLLRGSTLQRFQAYQIARVCGWLSNDDIRRLEDLAPIAPEDVPLYAQPLNSNTSGAASSAGGEGAAGANGADLASLMERITALEGALASS